jgi:hypothetical protein
MQRMIKKILRTVLIERFPLQRFWLVSTAWDACLSENSLAVSRHVQKTFKRVAAYMHDGVYFELFSSNPGGPASKDGG